MAKWPESPNAYPGTPKAYPAAPKAYPAEGANNYPPVGPGLNVPTLAVQEGGLDVTTADEGDDLVAEVTVDDGDGATTSDVELSLNGVSLGSMTDDGGGAWSLALANVLPGSHGYQATRITDLGNRSSATWTVTVSAQAPALDAPLDEATVTIGDDLDFEATGTVDGFDANTDHMDFYVGAVLRATAASDTAGVWMATWDTTGATPATDQAVLARRHWVGVSGQTGTVDSTDAVDVDLDAGGAPSNVPTMTIRNGATDVAFAPDIIALTARAVVDDGDGFTTTGGNFYRNGVLIGAASNAGGGVWTLAIAKQTQPPSATPHDYTFERVTASGNLTSAAYACEIANLLTIFGTLAQYCRTTDVTISGGTHVTAMADLSGNGRTMDHSAEPAVYTASDAVMNNQPTMRYSSATNSLRGVSPAWARAAPSVTKRWIVMAFRAELSSASGRVLFGDTTATTFSVEQTNTSNTLVQKNGNTANLNSAGALNVATRVEAYHTNSLATDYLKVGATTVSGQNAGNNAAGSAKRVGGSSVGARVQGAMTEHAEYEGVPTLAQLSKTDAYMNMAYGVTV